MGKRQTLEALQPLTLAVSAYLLLSSPLTEEEDEDDDDDNDEGDSDDSGLTWSWMQMNMGFLHYEGLFSTLMNQLSNR